MNDPGKSDRPVVPMKSAKVDYWEFHQWYAERMKGRGLAKENGEDGQRTALPPAGPAKQIDRTQSRVGTGVDGPEDLQSALDRIRQAALADKGLKFTSLWHHVYNINRLREAYFALKRYASPGVDGQTWQEYGQDLESNLRDLSERLVRGTYRARPVRRGYVPKAGGKQRPIGIPTLEDKIVQRAAAAVLNAVYEADFLGFSYGFRPGRSAHMALDALAVGIQTKKVNWVLDADIRSFFDTLSHERLMELLGHRIADQRVLRHIHKWLKAGVLEDGRRMEQEEGAVQGGSISPLLANVYLHYVFDQWAVQWRDRQARGDMIIVRYADDFVIGFQHESDAARFLAELTERFRQFNLELHADKTRVIEFGRLAAERQERRGKGKPPTFNFLGFTHICGTTRQGRFIVLRQTMTKRMQAKLTELKAALRKRMHEGIAATGRWLGAVVAGHLRYYGVPRNYPALDRFRDRVKRLWRRMLNLRGQKGYISEVRMARIVACWLPKPRICQPYPEDRLRVIIQGRSPVR